MSRSMKKMVLMAGLVMQLIMAMVFSFTSIPVSEVTCFGVWCAVAYVMYRTIYSPEIA